jgi:serine-type D-Ala-D-Ala carboxypeptidase (penicillin-binding protein 5/6)
LKSIQYRPILPVCSVIVAVCVCSSNVAQASTEPKLPSLTSPQWILQHWATDLANTRHNATTLASVAADTPTQPASITKLLTAYTVLQALKSSRDTTTLATRIPISALAVAQDGTKVGYHTGDQVALQDVLQGMLAISGNDAAWALAEYFGQGNVKVFVAQMTAQSQRLGLRHSQWQNPHGLTETGHVSSAADLLSIAHALWQDFPQHRSWLSAKSYSWQGLTQNNRNTLLWQDAHIDGLKTGHTDAAGYNLATTGHWWAKVGSDYYDWRLSTLTLGAASADARTKDTARLLAWGREQFVPTRVFAKTDVLEHISIPKALGQFAVTPKAAIWLVLPKEFSANQLRYEFVAQPHLSAPLKAGDPLGMITLYLNDTVQLSVPAVTAVAIESASLWERSFAWIQSLL